MVKKIQSRRFVLNHRLNTEVQILGKKLDTTAKHLKGFIKDIRIDHDIDYRGGSLILFMKCYGDSEKIREQAIRSQHYARSIIGAEYVDLEKTVVEGQLCLIYSVSLKDPMVRVKGEVQSTRFLDTIDIAPSHRRGYENLVKSLFKVKYSSNPHKIEKNLQILFDNDDVKLLDLKICNKLFDIVFPEAKKSQSKALIGLDALRVKEGL
jgi:hypothetical protein